MEAKIPQWREEWLPRGHLTAAVRGLPPPPHGVGEVQKDILRSVLQKKRPVQGRGQHCASNNVNGLIKGTLTKPGILQPGISGSGWQPGHTALTSN